MYFWKIKSLKNDLINGSISQRSIFIYVMLYVVCAQIIIEFLNYYPLLENTNIWDKSASVTNILLIMFGSIYLYLCNGGNNGEKFADRYFSLSLVVSIRACVFFLAPALILFFTMISPMDENLIQTTWIEYILGTIFGVGIYWRISVHIKDVASTFNH